ncbi:unnamed protein product, partial [Ectocarpus fasciculatus]
ELSLPLFACLDGLLSTEPRVLNPTLELLFPPLRCFRFVEVKRTIVAENQFDGLLSRGSLAGLHRRRHRRLYHLRFRDQTFGNDALRYPSGTPAPKALRDSTRLFFRLQPRGKIFGGRTVAATATAFDAPVVGTGKKYRFFA